MDVNQAIDDACAIEKKVYLLFPAGRRITAYSQQVRALTLVEALRQTEWMPAIQSVAIVGGGISGITAAMALHVAGLRDNLQITLFESRDRIVPLQASCRDKMLAPHIIDWPKAGSQETHADLPLLDWTAGMAGEVAIDLVRQFERTEIQPRTQSKVVRIRPEGHGVLLDIEHAGATTTELFEMVVVAAGFGLEKQPENILTPTPSYWRVIRDQQVSLTEDAAKKILISGLGDGGLIDFVLFACPALSHERLCQDLISSSDVAPLAGRIEEIEAAVWGQPPTVGDIADEYTKMNLDAVARALILPNLVRNKAFTLLTRGTGELARTAAPLNRIAAAVVLHAIRNHKGHGTTVDVVTNAELLREEPDNIYVYRTPTGEVQGKFDLAIVRHGDTQKEAWSFGCPAIDTKVSELRVKRDAATGMPETPTLDPAVRSAIAERALKTMTTRILVSRNGSKATWQSDINIDRAGRLWPSANVVLEIPFAPSTDPDKLDLALCRLMGHLDPPARLKSPYHQQWRDLINKTHRLAGGGPQQPAAHHGAVTVQRNPFANESDLVAKHLSYALDLGLLELLDGRMREFALDPNTVMPIELHADIRAKVLGAWPHWHAHVAGKGADERDWILTLFGNLLDERGEISPWVRIRAGPRCVEREILPGVICHLALKVLLADFGDAAKQRNGNVTRLKDGLTAAHVCGTDYAVGDDGIAENINAWDPRYPGTEWLPSALVLPNRRADFLPPDSPLRGSSSSRMMSRTWARPAIVHATPRLMKSLRVGEDEAAAELLNMLGIKLPEL